MCHLHCYLCNEPQFLLALYKQRKIETYNQRASSLNCLKKDFFLDSQQFNKKKILFQSPNLPQPHHLLLWDFQNTWSCLELWSGDRQQVTGDRWRMTCNISKLSIKKIVLVLLSAHIERLSVSRVRDFYSTRLPYLFSWLVWGLDQETRVRMPDVTGL